ncbi:CoxG family protein [Limnochorda pilosa]|uniref:Carbon monoxide dehydrogenase subunit G n=1 Tax=Limnochorda pilosa TaxID=1555112 RepID=A0A0K2SJF8_LIMPI|nr:carbon monoxide dehydrogenase subunit G [Limnochorda pilosa]BAS26989.1 carbon monoxide dehydrogenase subunit G [Limnochorda pilosa]
MQLEYRHQYGGLAPDVLWGALFDPEILRRAIPGCQGLEGQGDGAYKASLGLNVGPIRGGFDGQVALSDAEPPRRYRLRLDGGGAPGQVKADAWISLEPDGQGTSLLCRAEVSATGTLAAVGQRVMGSVGKMLVGRFFKNIEHELSGQRATG